jgi:hypothetical protein
MSVHCPSRPSPQSLRAFARFDLTLSVAGVVILAMKLAAVAAPLTPAFRESYALPLGTYWCENHLSVADLDGDRKADIVLMLTGLTNPSERRR